MCTFHHVHPDFHELLYTFGLYSSSESYRTRFIQETRFDQAPIPELGRSRLQDRLAYKLCAMEKSNFDGKWTMRQAAVYNSLDMSTGRLFWMVINANGAIHDKINEASSRKTAPLGTIPTSLTDSLRTAFSAHMLILDWSCQGWHWHITKLEEEARNYLKKVTAAPIPSNEKTFDPVPELVRALSFPSSEATPPVLPAFSSPGTVLSSSPCPPEKSIAATTDRSPTIESCQDGFQFRSEDNQSRIAQVEQTTKRHNILKEFSLEERRRLNSVLRKTNQAKMAMSMNIRILEDLNMHYKVLLEAPELRHLIFNTSGQHYRQFQLRVASLQRRLESECLRVEALNEQIRDDVALVS